MLHKDKWDMDKHKKYDFKRRAKKFYLDMNGDLYTKVSHKDSISKVTASKLVYICMFLICSLDAFQSFKVLQRNKTHPKKAIDWVCK